MAPGNREAKIALGSGFGFGEKGARKHALPIDERAVDSGPT